MTFRTTLAGAAGLTVAVILTSGLSACAPTPEEVVEPTPTFSDEAEAFAAAERTYLAYVDAVNEVDLDDPKTFDGMFVLTGGALNTSDRRTFSEWHADGLEKSGVARVISFEGVSVTHQASRVTARSCYDVSAVDIKDQTGVSLVEPGRPGTQALELTLVSSHSAPFGLVLTSIEPAEGDNRC